MSQQMFCTFRCRDDWRIRTRHGAYAVRVDRLSEWTADLAYFVGLMITDGNVRTSGAVNFVSLDRSSTEFVRDFIAPDTAIREEITRAGGTAYRWSVYSGSLRDGLARFGILPRKSLTVELPSVPDSVVWDFIRGLLDGDGSVDQSRRASFSTGSEMFALGLYEFFTARGLTARIQSKSRAFAVYLSVGSSRELVRLMYRPGVPHLERKRVRFGRVGHEVMGTAV
jgi:hypothetical protein